MGQRLLINPGDRYNSWTILREAPMTQHHNRKFICLCDCGLIYNVRMSDITTNKSKCCRKCSMRQDLIDNIYGRWTVLSNDEVNIRRVVCKCTCGTIRSVFKFSLLSGDSSSCGCLQQELVSEMCKKRKGIPNYKIRGANHYNYGKRGRDSHFWKEDKLTSEDLLERITISVYINPIIRKRQEYHCIKCDTTAFKKEVHHIFNFYKYKDLRQSEYNLVMFCEDCHREFHAIYGNRQNNLEQFENFIEHEYKYRQSLLNYYEYYYC